jgi:uncharacterized protein (TIGR02996 family)
MEPPATDDPAAWLVYADWLQMQAEPQWRALGEVIALDHAAGGSEAARRRIRSLTETYHDAWLGSLAKLPLGALHGFAAGFPRCLSVHVERGEHDLAALIAQVLRHPMAARVEDIQIDLGNCEEGASLAPVVQVLAETGRPRSLRRLALEEPPNLDIPWENEPPHIGDVGALWRRFSLERLILDGRGITLGDVHAPRLRELTLGGVGCVGLDQLGRADLPQVTDLRLSVAAPEDVPALLPLLDGARLPSLRRLTLGSGHAQAASEIVALLPALGVLARVDGLDLSWMRIQDHDVPVLARQQAGLANLQWIRVNVRSLTSRGRADLPSLGHKFECLRARYP